MTESGDDEVTADSGDCTAKAITPPKNTKEVAPTVNNTGLKRGRLIGCTPYTVIREY